MSNRDNALWLQFWRDRRDDFHQKTVNHLLTQFWPDLKLATGSRVFVPLCGKSLDMIWLAEQGHRVIGVELSPVAVKAFFQENNLRPTRRKVGRFTRWQHGNIRILCGDYFSLTSADLGEIDTVYDRAALTALPEDIRLLYVAKLQQLLPDTATVFLLTTEESDANDAELSLSVDEEIKLLYSQGFNIDLAHAESLFEQELMSKDQAPIRADYKLYRLQPNKPVDRVN